MKDYIQELADMGTADVTAVTPKVIAAVIEEIRRDRNIWQQFYKPNRDLMTGGGREIDFPKKKTGITASWDVSPGTGLSVSSMSFDAVTIPIKKGGVAIGFRGEAIRQAQRDVLADAIKEAGEVWADTLDQVAFQAMFPLGMETVAVQGTLSNSFVIGIKSWGGARTTGTIQQASTGQCIEQNSIAATLSYWYVPKTGVLSTDTVAVRRMNSSSLKWIAKDLLRSRADMIAKHHRPNVYVMHPTALTDILYDNTIKFLEGSAIRGKGEVYNGELGRIWDLRVIVTNKMPRYGIAVLDAPNIGYEIHRKPMKLTRDEYSGMSMDVLYFWGFEELNFGVNNAHAYGALAQLGNLTELDKFTP